MPPIVHWSPVALWPVLTLGLHGMVAAEPTGKTDEPTAAVAQLPADHAERQRDKLVSAAARTAVNSVRAAVRVLANGEADQAKPLVAQAQRILNEILADLRGRKDPTALGAATIPLLARVRLTNGGDIEPAVAARIEALEPLILTGEHEQVLAQLQGIGAALTYDYVGMPVQATSNRIERASTALTAGDNETALEDLRAIIQGLDTRTVTISPAETSDGKPPDPHPDS